MSGALRAVGQVAGIVASVAAFIPGGQPIAAVASAVALTASIGAQITAKKPAAQGSQTNITIGANAPSPFILGESYYGGYRVHLTGYGEEDDVPNAYLAAVDVYGVGGPYTELVATYMDFVPITFSGGEAVGFYDDHLYIDTQLGATPEATALTPFYAGTPDWGPGNKLSGKAAIFWNARFPKSGKKFGSGFPQTGAVWKGPAAYDPREDTTYPGGSGAQRWADPSDKVAFAAAKPTWTYSGGNPGVDALNYCLGRWERDETNTAAEYTKVFGIGLGWDGVLVEDFVTLANLCDDNGWTCNGVIFEPGDRWANLKSILQAGGAEPCFRGGRLGLRLNMPRVALDTIARDDIADGEITVPGMQSYRDRVNTIIAEYRSPDHKWEYVSIQEAVRVVEYATEDGEEKANTVRYNLVTDPDQAAQLAGYDLVAGREVGPVELPCKPRLRAYGPGDLLTLDLPEAGLVGDYLILQRSIDPATMIVNLTLVSENPDKHEYALGLTGTSPPAISIQSPENTDNIAGSGSSSVTDFNILPGDDTFLYSMNLPTSDRWSAVDILYGMTDDVSLASTFGLGITGAPGETKSANVPITPDGSYYFWARSYDVDDNPLATVGPVLATIA